jgi:hypothetical protein
MVQLSHKVHGFYSRGGLVFSQFVIKADELLIARGQAQRVSGKTWAPVLLPWSGYNRHGGIKYAFIESPF